MSNDETHVPEQAHFPHAGDLELRPLPGGARAVRRLLPCRQERPR